MRYFIVNTEDKKCLTEYMLNVISSYAIKALEKENYRIDEGEFMFFPEEEGSLYVAVLIGHTVIDDSVPMDLEYEDMVQGKIKYISV